MSIQKKDKMKSIIIAAVFSALLASCKKETAETTISTNLIFTSVTTPPTALQGKDIVSTVRFYAPDLCYSFNGIQIKPNADKHFDISIKATIPNSASGIACAQVLTYFDTTINVATTTKGKYILRFYNNDILFKADTVQVN